MKKTKLFLIGAVAIMTLVSLHSVSANCPPKKGYAYADDTGVHDYILEMSFPDITSMALERIDVFEYDDGHGWRFSDNEEPWLPCPGDLLANGYRYYEDYLPGEYVCPPWATLNIPLYGDCEYPQTLDECMGK